MDYDYSLVIFLVIFIPLVEKEKGWQELEEVWEREKGRKRERKEKREREKERVLRFGNYIEKFGHEKRNGNSSFMGIWNVDFKVMSGNYIYIYLSDYWIKLLF